MKTKATYMILIFFWITLLSSKTITLESIKKDTGIPIKKIKTYLNIDKNFPKDKSLENITETDIKNLKEKFNKEKKAFIISITLSGMGVVFISLIVVAFLIAQFAHIKKIQEKIGPEKRCRNLTNDTLIAAMFTIYLHELEVEEQNKLMLTWKRASISMWKAVSKAETPNTNFYKERFK